MINIPDTRKKRIVVVGGGFGGITLINRLKNSDFQIVLLDKNNHFTFQPLLYQVATAGLEPNSIVYPFRRMFSNHRNFYFRMAEVESIDTVAQQVETNIGNLKYDYLIVATGSKPNYFGLDSDKLFSLKSLQDALNMKNAILHTFEQALEAATKRKKEALFNIVIVGGGPTGVELAGALGEMKKFVLPNDYPQLDFDELKIHLLEGQERLLPAMSEEASDKAKVYLEQLGVEVRLQAFVDDYQDDVVQMEGDQILAKNLVWTAGMKMEPLAGLDEFPTLKSGRLKVNTANQLLGASNIFALGDIAGMASEEYPKGHPMLAPVAIQQAKQLAENLERKEMALPLIPFSYMDKGTMATIGRNRAVVDAPWFKMQGGLAWFAWMFVHLITLVGFRNKLVTLIDWAYNYFTYDRALRIINRSNIPKTKEQEYPVSSK
jgi:NADH dehydrogenase